MEKLVERLHAQHRAIGEIAADISRYLATGDVVAASAALRHLRTAVVAHLELEDAQLYPALEKAARETNAPVPARVALTYVKNMEGVSAALRAFFDHYAAKDGEEDVALDELRRDWDLVARMLLDRIESEEAQLYPLYETWALGNKRP